MQKRLKPFANLKQNAIFIFFGRKNKQWLFCATKYVAKLMKKMHFFVFLE